jgi:hypothetical protein
VLLQRKAPPEYRFGRRKSGSDNREDALLALSPLCCERFVVLGQANEELFPSFALLPETCPLGCPRGRQAGGRDEIVLRTPSPVEFGRNL